MLESHHNSPIAIVAGYGPVGRLVSQQLNQAGFDVVIVELNLKTIEKQLNLDKRVVYGSATDPNILKLAGIEHANAFALTIPDEREVVRACRLARELNPKIRITARTNYMSQGMQAQMAGADAVIVEEVVTAQAMRDAVLNSLPDEHPTTH